MAGNQLINNNSTQPLGGPNQGLGTDQGDTWDVAAAKLNNWIAAGNSGTAIAGLSGDIGRVAGPIATSATNVTQTLASFVLPASALGSVGQNIQVTAWGVAAANANSKAISMAVGGATYNAGTTTGSGFSWILEANTIKTSSNQQDTIFTGQSSGVIVAPKNQTDTSVDTSTINITVTASGTANDVTLYGLTIEYFS